MNPAAWILVVSVYSGGVVFGKITEHSIGVILSNTAPRRGDIELAYRYAYLGTLCRHNAQGFIEERNYTNYRFKFSYTHTLNFINVGNNFDYNYTICNTLQWKVFAIFGIYDTFTADFVASTTGLYHIPYITPTSPEISYRPHGDYMIHMQPRYAQALVDYILLRRWKSVTYIYDSNKEGLARMYHVVGAINNAGAYVVIHFKYVTNVTDALAKLAAMDKAGSEKKHNVIIDMSLNDTNTILKRRSKDLHSKCITSLLVSPISAAAVNLNTDEETPQTKLLYNYLIARLFTNEIDFKAFPAGGMNISGFHMVDYDTDVTVKKYNQVYRRCDLKCGSFDNTCPTSNGAAFAADSLTVFIKAMDMLHKNSSFNFPTNNPYPKNSDGLACAEWPNAPKPWQYGDKLIGALKKVELDGLTGKILFDEDGYRKNFTLYLFGTTSQKGPAKLGTWESHPRRLNRPRLTLIYDTKSVGLLNADPDNKTYIVTTILRDPYMMEKIHPRPGGGNWTGNDRYEGFCKDIIDQLMRDLNMNYELRVVADGSHGSKQKGNVTHPWNGMVWELMTEVSADKDNLGPETRADMAIGDLTISAEREKVIDFTKPFMNLGISIMIRKTPGSQFDITDMFIFMVPLAKEIWMCIAFAYLGVSVVLFLVSRFSPAEWLINDPLEDDGKKKTCVRNDFGIYNSLWFALAAFMQQGCEICPRSVSGRIVGSVWWFFTLIVISSYTANLAAFLTTSRMISPIGSAEDLAAQTEISYATSREGTSRDFFRESKISTYERMWAYMSSRPHNFPKNNAEGVRRVRDENDKFAFLMESTSIDYHSNREDCTTTRVGDLLNSRSYGIGMPKGFSQKNVVTLQLLTLVESAFVEERRKYWWEEDDSRRGLCKDRQDTNNKGEDTSSSLSISKIAGIFIILLCGMMMGIIISILELFYKTKIDAFRKHITFSKEFQSNAQLLIKGKMPLKDGEDASEDVLPGDTAVKCTNTTPFAQLITLDGYSDNTQTEV